MANFRRIAVVMGTRPEAIKLAPVIASLRERADAETIVVATGQHREMLQQAIDLFGILVDHDLTVMRPKQSLASLTARLMTGIDGLLEQIRPELVLVQGDTTTVLTTALACFYRGISVGHVEAGLRTGDVRSPFPEEANRRLAAPLVSLHFAPTETARRNLLNEGTPDAAVTVTGNTVIDALLLEIERQKKPEIASAVATALAALVGRDWDRVPYVLVTGHRRENFGEGFRQICDGLRALALRFTDHRIIYPVHLNPQVQEPVRELVGGLSNVVLLPPLGYRPFVTLMRHCRLLLTDSGGVQEEAPSLGKPVLVMRDTTERPEGIVAGTVRLVGTRARRIFEEAALLLTSDAAYSKMATATNPYGDGFAARRITQRILDGATPGIRRTPRRLTPR